MRGNLVPRIFSIFASTAFVGTCLPCSYLAESVNKCRKKKPRRHSTSPVPLPYLSDSVCLSLFSVSMKNSLHHQCMWVSVCLCLSVTLAIWRAVAVSSSSCPSLRQAISPFPFLAPSFSPCLSRTNSLCLSPHCLQWISVFLHNRSTHHSAEVGAPAIRTFE